MGGPTPEGEVKKSVKKVLANSKRFGYIHSWWPVPAGYGENHLDCIGCYRGRYFAIETKRPGKTLTVPQAECGREIIAAGGVVFMIDGDTSALEEWLGKVRDGLDAPSGVDYPAGCTAERDIPQV